MACIDGARVMLRGSEEAEQTSSSNWNIVIFGISLSIAREVIHKFVRLLESGATERIWKPICKATINYEYSRGITARSKKEKYQRARGCWTVKNAIVIVIVYQVAIYLSFLTL
jgi:hypothetical protein